MSVAPHLVRLGARAGAGVVGVGVGVGVGVRVGVRVRVRKRDGVKRRTNVRAWVRTRALGFERKG